MGSYDSMRFLNGAPNCAAGHDLPELQSKDLDGAFEPWYVRNGYLYRFGERQEKEPVNDGEMSPPPRLVAVTLDIYQRDGAAKRIVRAYNFCPECEEIVFFDSCGDVRGARPWCEFKFHFAAGELASVELIALETRADAAQSMRGHGYRVFDDDDPIAIHYRKKRGAL